MYIALQFVHLCTILYFVPIVWLMLSNIWRALFPSENKLLICSQKNKKGFRAKWAFFINSFGYPSATRKTCLVLNNGLAWKCMTEFEYLLTIIKRWAILITWAEVQTHTNATIRTKLKTDVHARGAPKDY